MICTALQRPPWRAVATTRDRGQLTLRALARAVAARTESVTLTLATAHPANPVVMVIVTAHTTL